MSRLDEFHRLRASQTDDCIVWPYAKTPEGYGQVRIGDRVFSTHRLALIFASGGSAPPSMEAAHGPCHNRACMNVRHLRWATRAQNNDDKKRDGTEVSTCGEDHPCAKLTVADVLAIRASNDTQAALAVRYGVNQSTICRARLNRTWTEAAA